MQQFFPLLDKALLPNTIELLADELNRIQKLAEQQSSTQLLATFQELSRPREQLIRYSGLRSVLTAAGPAQLLAQLCLELINN